jgi:hypothetical protein
MSKFAKVKLANILTGSGYPVKNVLSAIRYPKCTHIGFVAYNLTPPPPDFEITVEQDGERETFKPETNVQYELRNPVFSGISKSIWEEVSIVIEFTFGKEPSKSRLLETSPKVTPPVPSWPIPDALKDIEESMKEGAD